MIPWDYIYRSLAEKYQWPPWVVDKLTPRQVKIYICKIEELQGKQISQSNVLFEMRKMKAFKKQAVENLLAGRRWNDFGEKKQCPASS